MPENKNDHVVIAFFSSAEVAQQATDALKTWDQANDDVKLGAIGTMRKEGDKIKTDMGRRTGRGLAVGAVVGVIAAALGPVGLIGGAVAGGALGGVVGAFLKKSVNLTQEEIDKIGVELDRGQTAVVVACDEFEVGPTSEQLQAAGGTVFSYEVSAEAVDAAAQAIAAEAAPAVAERSAEVVSLAAITPGGQGFAPVGAEAER